MNRRITIQCLCLTILAFANCYAVPPAIGVASAVGTFIVNSSQVQGNANLFEGSELKTGKASSQVFLQNGAALTLGSDSAGTVYRDHLLLQSGSTKVDNMNGYSVRTLDFRIEEGQPSSQAVVLLDGEMVEVAALAGSLNVFDSKGALLTHVGAGTASAFQTGTSGEDGTPTPNNNTRRRKEALAYAALAVTLAGLGLAVVAIVQPAPTSR